MINSIKQYANWLHGQWPTAKVEKLPMVNSDGMSSIKGIYIVGDLTGVPLLKLSADSGTKVVRHICTDSKFLERSQKENVYDLIIIGGGVSGYAAALEAKEKGLNFVLLEASEPFSTIKNFPKEKPIYTYPTEMSPEGALQFGEDDDVKEKLFANLKQKVDAAQIETLIEKAHNIRRNNKYFDVEINDGIHLSSHRVIVAIGRTGNFRQLNVMGEEKNKVINRLHDPEEFRDQDILVVGGGDSAVEAAIALQQVSSKVSLSYRQHDFSRTREENRKKLLDLEEQQKINIYRSSKVTEIGDDQVELQLEDGDNKFIKNHVVFSLIGREAPLNFFRRSKIAIQGESSFTGWIYFSLFFVFAIAIYDWKNYGFLNSLWGLTQFPDQMPASIKSLGEWWQVQVEDRSSVLGTLAVSMKSRSFYYTLLYTFCIGFFGWKRIQRRQTPYVKYQTISLFLIQFIPLFMLPEFLLPWLGYNGAFDSGFGKSIADSLFPSYISLEAYLSQQWPDWGHPRAYWHAYGFILAWPLNVYNVFTATPIMGWLIISFIQTFILIPLLIYKYGKGAYCGWICSCGALAETMGDTQRHKMPRGKIWNKLNFIGQFILLAAVVLLFIRVGGWIFTESWMASSFDLILKGEQNSKLINPLSWKWTVDVLLGGILGVGLYFKYSGRVWCRFACPLAALMNIYTRFSRFRIFADKKKCISCNQCTSVCHQGIDVMSFANKGKPMEDPQCVRCSACVEVCPTGVLQFGEIDKHDQIPIRFDSLAASPVRIQEVAGANK